MTANDITPLVLVTGPTRGLGRDLVLALARRRTSLLLLGRDVAATAEVAKQARNAGAPLAEIIAIDLASFASIRSAVAGDEGVAAVAKRLDLGPIDAVVANAGIQMSSRTQTTEDGLEMTFGVNVIGNHLLLNMLRPMLASEAHVVVVGSGTHFGDPMTRMVVAAPVWEDPVSLARIGGEGGDSAKAGQRAYSTSKLGVNYLVHELNRRWGAPVRVNIYDPGLMPGTGLARDLPRFKQFAWDNIMPALRVFPGVTSTVNSAERLARFTLGEEHRTATNAYVAIGKLSAVSKESDDPRREAALWDYCEQITSLDTYPS